MTFRRVSSRLAATFAAACPLFAAVEAPATERSACDWLPSCLAPTCDGVDCESLLDPGCDPFGCEAGGCDAVGCDAVGCDATGCDATDCCGRQTLLGDPFGVRAGLAENGLSVVTFDVTQVYQNVTTGGLERTGAYGGHSDLVFLANFGQMGGPEGLLLQVRAEGNFGESITDAAGVVLPPAIQTELPVAGERNYAVTNFLFTQLLSERFAVFAGKNDSLTGDVNAFAHGRGKTQFLNSAFVVNPVGLRTVPYSALLAGFSVLGEGAEPLFTFAAWNPVDTATEVGLDELYADGVTLAGELRLPVEVAGRPGHQLFAATWSSRDFLALEQDPRVLLPVVGLPGPAVEQTSGSWSAYWNMDQYLYVDPCDPTRGWGVFARYGAADLDSSPLAHFASVGLGGVGPLDSRPTDSWGVGYYYAWSSDSFVTNLIQLEDGQGFEAYYRAMLTPYFDVTPDVQVLDGGRTEFGQAEEDAAALVLGVRANLRF